MDIIIVLCKSVSLNMDVLRHKTTKLLHRAHSRICSPPSPIPLKTQKNPQQCSRYNSIAVFSPHYEVENAGIKRL